MNNGELTRKFRIRLTDLRISMNKLLDDILQEVDQEELRNKKEEKIKDEKSETD